MTLEPSPLSPLVTLKLGLEFGFDKEYDNHEGSGVPDGVSIEVIPE